MENILTSLRQLQDLSPELALRAPEQLELLAIEQLSERWRNETDRAIRGLEAVKRQGGKRTVLPGTFDERDSKNVCPNAALYRNNQCDFDQVAVLQPGVNAIQQWACRLCGTSISRASIPLLLGDSKSDQLFITPVGFFKAHSGCRGEGPWFCIWERRSEKCAQSFGRKRDLLYHMQEIHVRSQEKNGMLIVDLPGDRRVLSTAKCGYGVSHVGNEMRMGGGSFIVD